MEQTRILCVDDERNVLRALERLFIDYDYEIVSACSGEEGLDLLREEPAQVVISDYRMPGMNGVDFLKEVCQKFPATIRIVLSGYADTAAVVAAINEGKIYKFIPKPWNDDELRMTVAKALESSAILRRNEQLAGELGQKNAELSELNANLERLVYERTAELREQNLALQHARSILNHLPVGVLGLTAGGIVLQMNREAGQLLGVAPHEVIGKQICQALPLEVRVLADSIADCSCGCRKIEVNGTGLSISGSLIAEENEPMVVLAITREQGGCA